MGGWVCVHTQLCTHCLTDDIKANHPSDEAISPLLFFSRSVSVKITPPPPLPLSLSVSVNNPRSVSEKITPPPPLLLSPSPRSSCAASTSVTRTTAPTSSANTFSRSWPRSHRLLKSSALAVRGNRRPSLRRKLPPSRPAPPAHLRLPNPQQ